MFQCLTLLKHQSPGRSASCLLQYVLLSQPNRNTLTTLVVTRLQNAERMAWWQGPGTGEELNGYRGARSEYVLRDTQE
jgi:hypothetical protein